MRSWIAWLAALGAIIPVASASAQDLFIYAAQGQSQDQQDLDEVQCRRFATERTGFDPRETPRATTARPQAQGGALRGGARGDDSIGSVRGRRLVRGGTGRAT